MRAYPDVFSMTNRRPEGTKSRCEPGMWLRLALGQLSYDWCKYRSEDRVELSKAFKGESRDSRGFITVEISISQQEKSVHLWSGIRRNEWSV